MLSEAAVIFGLPLTALLQIGSLDLAALITQAPFIALVIWMVYQFQKWYTAAEEKNRAYVEEIDRRWREELKAIRSEAGRQQEKLIDTFNTNFTNQLANQRGSYLDSLIEQRQFYSEALTRMEAKLNRNSDIIDLLVQQISVNTASITEIAKMDDMLEFLIKKDKNGEPEK